MTFTFTQKPATTTLNMFLELEDSEGNIFQTGYGTKNTSKERILIYRKGRTGKWLSTEGLTFNGKPRTIENIIDVLNISPDAKQCWVLPEA